MVCFEVSIDSSTFNYLFHSFECLLCLLRFLYLFFVKFHASFSDEYFELCERLKLLLLIPVFEKKKEPKKIIHSQSVPGSVLVHKMKKNIAVIGAGMAGSILLSIVIMIIFTLVISHSYVRRMYIVRSCHIYFSQVCVQQSMQYIQVIK